MAWYDSWLKNRINGQIEDLLKADGVASPEPVKGMMGDTLPDRPETHHDADAQIGRKGIIDDPYFDNFTTQGTVKHRVSRLSNRTLKEVSLRDWLVSAIMQCRVDTLLAFSRPEHRRFEMGFKVVKHNPLEEYTEEDRQEIAAIEDFIYHCGRTGNTPQDDTMLFGEFLKLIARDALTFGHIAVEKVKTKGGGLHRFRPLPAESMYLIDKRLSRGQVEAQAKSMQPQLQAKSDNDPKQDQQVNEVPIDYYKYVQKSYDMRDLAHFGDEDLIFKLFNPQNFADSNGYCYSTLELAIINITNHLNVENYNANFFTHGYAARGILHLKGTVTQSQLMNFRRQFYNTISGQQHAWRTPIVAGLEDVQWVPMSANAKEMEYINFNNHLMRIICSQFQIDPVELGLEYLASANGRAPMQQANNEYKIVYSRERGLKPILMFVEDMINCDLLPSLDKKLSSKYRFVFTGYTDETPQTEIAQMQAEMTVWKSMNDLLTQSQKDKINTPAANLPMNQAFWALVEKNYTRGEIREQFFGDKGAASRRELMYIPGDPAFLQWQQTILAIDNAKKQEAQMASQEQQAAQEMQLKQQEAEQKHRHAEADHGRNQEKHDMDMEALKAQAASNAVQGGNPMKSAAKEFGASRATNVEGKMIANPINKLDDQE
jgi:hypothetical protein